MSGLLLFVALTEGQIHKPLLNRSSVDKQRVCVCVRQLQVSAYTHTRFFQLSVRRTAACEFGPDFDVLNLCLGTINVSYN